MTERLRPYQRELLEAVREAYRQGFQRPCLVLPCGGGKSVIVAEMARLAAAQGSRVLFVVHRQELCAQIDQTFRRWGVDMALCRVAMVQTVTRRLDREPEPGLIITDENHHCLAASYRKIYDRWPKVPCVGVTATPVRLGGGGLGDVNDTLVCGPDARWLIEHGFLAPCRCFTPAVADCSVLRSRRGEYAAEEAAELLMRPAVYGDVLRHYQTLAGGRKAVCYCSTVAHSRQAAREFSAAGIPAAHIDGTTPRAERDRIVQAFRTGALRILCNVDLISEGFDVPDCGCSILLRPTRSLTLYLQQAMRCMRFEPGKTAVILDHVGNILRHGLPDDSRQWSLDPGPVRGREAGERPVRQCPLCFYTHRPGPVCPNCGHVYEKTARELAQQKEAQLQEVVSRYRRPDQCRTVQELMAYARHRGYKPGWVYFQQKQRGWLH